MGDYSLSTTDTSYYLQNADQIKEQAQKEQAAKQQKIKEANQMSSLFGVDTDNFSSSATLGDNVAGIGQLLASPVTATFNVAGSLLGADVSTTNSTDNKGSGITGAFSGLLGSVGTLFKGGLNLCGGLLGGITGGNKTSKTNGTSGGQNNQVNSAGGNSAPASSTPTADSEKSAQKKTDTTPTTHTTSSGSSEKTSKSQNAQLGTFSHKFQTDSNGDLKSYTVDKAGNSVDVDTKGYEEVSTEVRTSVEEYNEAALDEKAADKELSDSESKLTEAKDALAKKNDEKQTAYAEAQGIYDGALKQVEYLQGKQDTLAADIKAMETSLSKCNEGDSQYTELKNSLSALKQQQEILKDQLKAAESKRDEAKTKLDEAKAALADTKPSAEAQKVSELTAKVEAAKDKKATATQLKEKAKSNLDKAVKNQDEKYDGMSDVEKASTMQESKAATDKINGELDETEKFVSSNIQKRDPKGNVKAQEAKKTESKIAENPAQTDDDEDWTLDAVSGFFVSKNDPTLGYDPELEEYFDTLTGQTVELEDDQDESSESPKNEVKQKQ